jgi:hypothetical protein
MLDRRAGSLVHDLGEAAAMALRRIALVAKQAEARA